MALKEELLRLLKRDEEFRYAVAGLIGLEEILRRLDRHEEGIRKVWEEIARLREDMIVGFKRHDEILAKHGEEMARLREDMVAGFKRHDEEIAKLREDMVAGFKRHDDEMARLREDMNKGFKRHEEEMAKGFALLERHISALGARWGLMAEGAFREGLRGLLEEELGLKVERWETFDGDGLVYGYPSQVEVDVAIRDEKAILVEVMSHANASDVAAFSRKAELYERKAGRKPSRLVIVTPYADGKAAEACLRRGIELYTKV